MKEMIRMKSKEGTIVKFDSITLCYVSEPLGNMIKNMSEDDTSIIKEEDYTDEVLYAFKFLCELHHWSAKDINYSDKDELATILKKAVPILHKYECYGLLNMYVEQININLVDYDPSKFGWHILYRIEDICEYEDLYPYEECIKWNYKVLNIIHKVINNKYYSINRKNELFDKLTKNTIKRIVFLPSIEYQYDVPHSHFLIVD